jgi:hypothetical protein
VETFEAEEFVFFFDFASHVFDLLIWLFLKGKKIFGGSKFVGVSGGKTLEEGVWLKSGVKLLDIDGAEFISSKNLLKELSNLSLLILRNLLCLSIR